MVSCEGLGNGGVQAIMMGIVRNLSSEYHFDMLLFTSEERYYDKEFLSYGGKIFRIPHYEGKSRIKRKILSLFRDIYIYRQLNKLLESQKPYDVIHCNKEYESAPLLKVAAKRSIPVRICHTHIISSKSGFILCVLNGRRKCIIKNYATHFFGCSKEACESFYHKSVTFQVVPNFYDDKKYSYSDIEQTKDTIVLAQLGAFSDNKNQLFSVRVAKCLIEMGKKVSLNLIGFSLDPDYQEKVKRVVKELELEECVVFLPGDTDCKRIFKRANAFLMPSKFEGFGIALIEAQATGIQCFASDTIPQTTNCGEVSYMDINGADSANRWAEAIKDRYYKDGLVHKCYDTNKYKLTYVMNIYKEIYK